MERLELGDVGDGADGADGGALATLNAATYYGSWLVQVAGAVLAVVALATASDAVPGVIFYLLVLDLAVQAIELGFYTSARLVLGSAGAVADRLWLRYGERSCQA